MTYAVRVTRPDGHEFDVTPNNGWTGLLVGETERERAERSAVSWRKTFPKYTVEVVEVAEA